MPQSKVCFVLCLVCFVGAPTTAVDNIGPTKAHPTWEPDSLEYYGTAQGNLQEPKRFTSLTVEEFARLGTTGVPFIITDGCKDCPMKSWDCEELSRKFHGVKFRREYGNDEQNHETFGKSKWTTQKIKIKRRKKLPKDAPQYAPFYSDLVKAWRDEKERGWGNKKAVKNMEKAVKAASEPLYFMEAVNAREMKQNPEFWLQPPETGSLAHMDEHCIPTIATTLSGVKRWRLAEIPANPHPAGYFDGQVYDRGEWNPIFNFTTYPGETLVFPPGMIHEGLSIGDVCVSSITYQFTTPAPVAYFRSFFPRIRRTKDLQNCLPMVAEWATLNDRSYRPQPFVSAEAYARKLAATLDIDKDGQLSIEEVRARMPRQKAMEAVKYHDINGDGYTYVDEFVQGFAAWSAVEFKAKQDGVKFLEDDEL